MRALIVSAPTLDELEFAATGMTSVAPGGPGLFAGITYRRLGYDVCSVGPYGVRVANVVKFELSLGLRRLCCDGAGEGFVVHHTYLATGQRRTRIVSRASPLSPKSVADAIRECDPDIVLVSPNFDEAPLDIIRAAGPSDRVVLDVQGYARSGGDGWWNLIPAWSARLVHMSDDDGPYTVARELSRKFDALLYTVGPGGAVAFHRGLATAMPSSGPTLDDRTGAGDVITALVSHNFIVRGLQLEEAYMESLDIFTSILKEAIALRRGAFLGKGG